MHFIICQFPVCILYVWFTDIRNQFFGLFICNPYLFTAFKHFHLHSREIQSEFKDICFRLFMKYNLFFDTILKRCILIRYFPATAVCQVVFFYAFFLNLQVLSCPALFFRTALFLATCYMARLIICLHAFSVFHRFLYWLYILDIF